MSDDRTLWAVHQQVSAGLERDAARARVAELEQRLALADRVIAALRFGRGRLLLDEWDAASPGPEGGSDGAA